MILANFVYLDKVQIFVEKEKDNYVVITENGYVINRYELEDTNELYALLEDIKYYWINEYEEEYENEAQQHESYEEMEQLLEKVYLLTV